MLVLTRKKGESIVVGDDVRIEFLGVDRRGKARIGIVAPDSVRIRRIEIVEADAAQIPAEAVA